MAAIVTGVVATEGGSGDARFYGLSGSQADATLSQVDPATLRPVGRPLRVGVFNADRAISPDGSTLALVSQERPVVRFVDLGRMRATGQATLAAEGEVQWLRWTPRGLVALVDLSRGSKLVWLDPSTRTVTRTLRYRGELVDPRLANGRVVAVEWPSGQVGPIRLNVIDADGRARSTRVERIAGGWQRRGGEVVRMAEPGLAVSPDGERSWLADGDGELCAVELGSLAIACRPLRTPAEVAKIGSPWSRRQLKLVAPGTLALSGWEKPTRGPRAAKAIGLWLVDAATWERRLLDREIDSFRAAAGVVVGVRRNGVTAYGSDGARRYGIEESLQLGVIRTTGPYLYVPRSDGRTVVADLASGRVLRRVATRVQPFQDVDTW
ncbi:MAG: hypothetical protein MSC30_08460 [Gaiellaceae bacterium MAG52_C11]|nr:hypothetical protein [Candidatus Gaiellasilicea maunaloa]